MSISSWNLFFESVFGLSFLLLDIVCLILLFLSLELFLLAVDLLLSSVLIATFFTFFGRILSFLSLDDLLSKSIFSSLNNPTLCVYLLL